MITFYDIPTKAADSPGTMITWRTRYCLNLKNLPYKTVYIEVPDIEALAKKIGAAPTDMWPDGVTPKYTVPIIQDHSTGAVISNSPAIAVYLDKTYLSIGPVLIPAGTMALQLAFHRRSEERKEMWAVTKKNLGKMDKWFEGSEGGGDFVMGEEPCFADTVLGAFFWLIRSTVGRESEEWRDIVTWNDGRWGKHLDRLGLYETVA
ncbi:uncharacterized protein EV420DRAFT_1620839 [Desarmillaria tabescens]|uniref:GST N-terminal domain-containing protein n=1 Tax=Armillaria tabescens TaxID=1929756 RepID=A0AA39KDK4_ARMTA|nr:uncharacterized protein EV420DRAFT_1620839 [Desarmillaria tabescens]KAK0457980.1 hypothetical protein EV420DRAFT_1620839 [Desarmillaria tabescens]